MAETYQVVTKVWIAPGCIVCDSCENDCPEVFEVLEDTCIIRPPAQSADFLRPRLKWLKENDPSPRVKSAAQEVLERKEKSQATPDEAR